MLKTIFNNFLGKVPLWYKCTILGFLIINPIVFFFVSPFVAGWMVLIQFIFTLALALQCYPVPSGGLLALQAVCMGITTPATIYSEAVSNLPTLLLLIFMVSGIYYLKDVLFLAFTKLFISFRKKWQVSLAFCMVAAMTTAFLGALTILAILIAVCFNFYAIYHRVYGAYADDPKNKDNQELNEFRGFLRNLIMHSAVGTALGGTLTLVAEPQNMMIGTKMGWSFVEYFKHCGVIAVPVSISGLILCPLLEIFRIPGYGYQLSDNIRELINNDYKKMAKEFAGQGMYKYILQALVAVLIALTLAFHLAEAGLVGLAVIVVISALSGKIHEHDYAEPFNNAMPFVTLILVFFVILAVVHDQHLITPVIQWVLTFDGPVQLLLLYLVNGAISMVSDSVFVASIFITEMDIAYKDGVFSIEWYQKLAAVINMGTNIPSLGTPNGTAGFLFLLTSALSPLIKLSYFQMLRIMIPYFVFLTSVGAIMVYFFLA